MSTASEQPARVYLDHAATTDVSLPLAIDAMVEQMRAGGNPPPARPGPHARATVEYARERIARAIGADPPRLFSLGRYRGG